MPAWDHFCSLNNRDGSGLLVDGINATKLQRELMHEVLYHEGICWFKGHNYQNQLTWIQFRNVAVYITKHGNSLVPYNFVSRLLNLAAEAPKTSDTLSKFCELLRIRSTISDLGKRVKFIFTIFQNLIIAAIYSPILSHYMIDEHIRTPGFSYGGSCRIFNR